MALKRQIFGKGTLPGFWASENDKGRDFVPYFRNDSENSEGSDELYFPDPSSPRSAEKIAAVNTEPPVKRPTIREWWARKPGQAFENYQVSWEGLHPFFPMGKINVGSDTRTQLGNPSSLAIG